MLELWVFETITIVENITGRPNQLFIERVDNIIVLEVNNLGSFAEGFVKEISVFDVVGINEFAVTPTPTIDRFDSIAITESVTVTTTGILNAQLVADVVTVREAVFLVSDQVTLTLSVFDAIAIVENLSTLGAVAQVAVRYVNYATGSDANSGLTWALAKKTVGSLSGLATSAIVKIAKSPDPVLLGDALVTDDHFEVLFADRAITKSIDECQFPWQTALTTITSTTTGGGKQGTNGNFNSIVIPSSFVSGKVVWRRLQPQNEGQYETLDLSAYAKLSFWMRKSTSDENTVGRYKIALCSDLDGNVIVDEFVLDTGLAAGKFMPFTLARTGGGFLGTAIKSIALYQVSAVGVSVTLALDNIFVTNTLNLRSVIGPHTLKHDDPRRGTDRTWYAIKNIYNYRVVLGTRGMVGSDLTASNRCKYQSRFRNRTEYIPFYHREGTIAGDPVGSFNLVALNQGCTYSFGWNTATDQVDGETFLDNVFNSTIGIPITDTTRNSAKIFRLGLIGLATGITISGTPSNLHFRDLWVVGCSSSGLTFGTSYFCVFQRVRCATNSGQSCSANGAIMEDCWFLGTDLSAMNISGAFDVAWRWCRFLGSRSNPTPMSNVYNNYFDFCDFGNTDGGAAAIGAVFVCELFFKECSIENAPNGGGFGSTQAMRVTFLDCVFRNNGVSFGDFTIVTQQAIREITLINTQLLTTPEVGGGVFSNSFGASSVKAFFKSQHHDAVSSAFKQVLMGGTVEADYSQFRSAAPCISMIPDNGGNFIAYSVEHNIPNYEGDRYLNQGDMQFAFKAPMQANTARTLSVYLKVDPGFFGVVKLMVRANGKTLIPPTALSPSITPFYQQYSLTVGAQEMPVSGVVELVVMREPSDPLRKVYMDDFNWS